MGTFVRETMSGESEMEPVWIFDDRYRAKPVRPNQTGRSTRDRLKGIITL